MRFARLLVSSLVVLALGAQVASAGLRDGAQAPQEEPEAVSEAVSGAVPGAVPEGMPDGRPDGPDRAEVEMRLEAARGLDPEVSGDLRDRLIDSYSATLFEIDQAATAELERERYAIRSQGSDLLAAALQSKIVKLKDAPPLDPATLDGMTLDALEEKAATSNLEVEDQRQRVSGFESKLRRELERRAEIASERAAVAGRLEALGPESGEAVPIDGATEVALAQGMRRAAERISLRARVETLQLEDATYDVRLELLRAEVRHAQMLEKSLEQARVAIESALNVKREAAARELAQLAQSAKDDALMASASFSPLASAIVLTREGTVLVTESLTDVAAKSERVRLRRERLSERYVDTQERVKIPSLTEAIGLRLREELRDLAKARSLSKEFDNVTTEQTQAQVQLFRIQGILQKLERDPNWHMQLVEGAVAGGTDKGTAERVAKKLHEDYRAALVAAEKALGAKIGEISDLQASRHKLKELIEEYEAFVLERVLWIRSSEPAWRVTPEALALEVRDALDPGDWGSCGEAIDRTVDERPVLIGGILIGLALLVGARRRLRRSISEEGELARQRSQISIAPTLRALLLTLLFAAPVATALFAAYWVASTLVVDTESASRAFAISEGCRRAAIAALVVGMIRALMLKDGLATDHFEWTDEAAKLVRRRSGILFVLAPLAAFLCEFFANMETSVDALGSMVASPFDTNVLTHAEGLSRLAFAVELAAIWTFLWAVLHGGRGVLAINARASSPSPWLKRLRRLWLIASCMLLAGLSAAAFFGYGFTARSLLGRFEVTLGFLIGLFILRAIALRWIRLVRRGEAIEKLRKKREELRAKRLAEIERRRSAGEDLDGLESEGLEVEEDTVDVASLSSDVLDLVRVVTGLAAMFGVVWIWSSVLPALGIFDQVHLWQQDVVVTEAVVAGDASTSVSRTITEWVTLVNVGVASLILLLTWLAIRDLPSLLEIVLLRRLSLGSGERYAITTLFRYVITILGLALAFDELGVSWSKLQWLVAGVSVGLGFGLQEIFANFVSGITLLFERPVRVGDWVTLGDIEGVVSKIRIRATTIRDRDLKELIVPNREFITGPFINWTLSDPVSRVTLAVGIAYGSDTEKAIQLLLDAGRDSPYTVAEPAPNVVFKSFGDSALDFELRTFVSGREIMPRVVHDLHMRVDASFRIAEIEISFPQTDLHVRSAPGLERSMLGPEGAPPTTNSI